MAKDRAYARAVNGVVLEVIRPQAPLEESFTAEFISGLTDVTGVSGIEQGWTYDGSTFRSPEAAPSVSLEDAKAAKEALTNAARDAIIAAGYHHPFGGTIGTRILDQRGPEDVMSWLTLKLLAQDLNSAGQGDMPLAIRDAKNSTFQAKASVVGEAMSAMGIWRAGILNRSWALKDAIEAAADKAAVDAIDIETGWPD